MTRQSFVKKETSNRINFKKIDQIHNFSLSEMEHEAYSIKDFDGNLWIKLGNSEYIKADNPQVIKGAKQIYESARTVMNSQGNLIAKRISRADCSVDEMVNNYDNWNYSDFELRRVRITYHKKRNGSN